MNARRSPPPHRDEVRLLAVDTLRHTLHDLRAHQLPTLLRRGDLLVLNDAATLPGSLHGALHDALHDEIDAGHGLELRLVRPLAPDDPGAWRVVLFGPGDWRTPTEHRAAPPVLAVGDRIVIRSAHGPTLHATVLAISPLSPRLLDVQLTAQGTSLWSALYALGRPIQYSYLAADVPLYAMQTAYAARPWAVEMPSAGRSLSWDTLLSLRRAGVRIATLTHAAGLSATGDAAIDHALPLPERYDLPAETITAVEETRASGGRVLAVGTTVVRALEGNARTHGGTLRPGENETDLVIDGGFHARIVSGLLSGLHDPSESHFHLLSAFAPADLLWQSFRHAESAGYNHHEFGDACLLAPDLTP